MDTLRELDIVRAIPAQTRPLELRAADDGSTLGRLVVRFSPFEVWYEVHSWWEGDFMERTVRGAFAKTMAESKDSIRALYDHGFDFSIGNKVLCPTDDLREDPDSAVLEGDLFDTSYNRDLVPGLRAGVYGSSFRFRVVQEQWNDEPGVSDHNPKGLPERTITEIRLFEAGPVTFPANPSATADLRSNAIRSTTDSYYERLRSQDPACEQLLARARALRDPAAAPRGTVGAARAAQQQPSEPAASHSTGYSPGARRGLIYRIPKGDNAA